MNKDEKRLLQRKRLMDNKVYQTMNDITRYMDRYYLDAVIGVIPGWGDIITIFCAVPFIYFSTRVIKSIPLTLAIINVFHRANTKNMAMIQGFVDGNETVIKEVNRKALQSAVVLIILLILIALMIWALVSFGSYLYSLIASILY